jgi:ABC-type Fe3+ transport system permease subunit
MILSSFIKEGSFSLGNYIEALNKKSFSLLLNSIGIAVTVSVFSTLTGGFLAFFSTKTDLPFVKPLKLIYLIPLFLSPYILAVSWVDFFHLLNLDKSFIYSAWGVILVLSLKFSPLAMIIISSSLRNLAAGFEEAGSMITCMRKVVTKIVLPLIKPAIISSFILIFILSISDFTVPAFLSTNVFTTEIFTQFAAFYNYDLAVANSIILILICASLLLIERFYLSDAAFFSVTSHSMRTRTIKLNKSRYLVLATFLIYALISVIIPIIVLSVQAFSGTGNALTKAFKLLLPTVIPSIFYGIISSFVLLFFAVIFAYLAERKNFKIIHPILLFTFAVPSTVIGIGLIKFFNTPSLNFIYSGFWIIIFGYLCRFIFITEKIVANAVKQISPSLEEAAKMMGANFSQRMRSIMLPLLSKGLFAAFLISFIFIIGELAITLLVYPPGTSVMPIKIFTLMANAPQNLVSAMSLVVLIITLIILGILMAGFKWIDKIFKKK